MVNDHEKKRGAWGWLRECWQNLVYRWIYWHDRRELLEMDEHMLKDIGISRADVQRMAGGRWQRAEPLTKQQYMQLDELQVLAFNKIHAEKGLEKQRSPQSLGQEEGAGAHTTEPGC